uniref:Uncharacterized protein n=1 Tax=Physcomitrium patens TaxID=3218 RepID=A0A2K1ISS9_PHYPA|nr:hypothetical protein PHYPA_026459 [Physcomitrium patens]
MTFSINRRKILQYLEKQPMKFQELWHPCTTFIIIVA